MDPLSIKSLDSFNFTSDHRSRESLPVEGSYLDTMPPPYTPRNLSADHTHSFTHPEAPPNTPATGYSLSPRDTGYRYSSLGHDSQTVIHRPNRSPLPPPNIPYPVDLRSLTYVGTVDENLICPICRVALVDPVDTDCDHTFCRDCIGEALSHSEVCPIDRYSLPRHAPLSRSHKIVVNQLDALLAKCPCCEAAIPRSMLQNHLERYCKDALVKCAGKTCEEVVTRKMYDRGCLHYNSICPDCKEILQEINLSNHREHDCKERHKCCEHCGIDILRCMESEHVEECQYIIAPCEWAEYGCHHESKRKDLYLHAEECNFKLVGPMAEMLKKEIADLRFEIRALTEKEQIQERRIKFLENGQKDSDRPLDYSDLPSQAISTLPDSSHAEPFDSAHEYLLSLVEAQETRVGRLSAAMTELEGKQTMMLFNETLQIKNEIAEMRSSQQVVSMHVRWLLNFRRQENQRRFGAGPSSGGGSDGGGPSSDGPLSRRLSDSVTRDLITKL